MGSAGLRFATMLHVLERHAGESSSISLSKHNNIDRFPYCGWENETAKNMEGSSSAQRKVRTGNKCVKNFLSKRQEVSFIAQC